MKLQTTNKTRVARRKVAAKNSKRKGFIVRSVQNCDLMSKKKFKNIVYSTNPDFNYEFEEEDQQETLDPGDQLLYISIDRKRRAGKEVTLIEGFVGDQTSLNDLAKKLKSACGVGGTSKDGEVLIQGNFRDKIVLILEKDGYRVKKKGG